MKDSTLLVCLLILAPFAHARPKGAVKAIWHYTTHHKEILISDAVMILAANASAAAYVHCQHTNLSCGESGLGAQGEGPFGNAKPYVLTNGIALGVSASDHLGYRNLEGSRLKHLVWFSS